MNLKKAYDAKKKQARLIYIFDVSSLKKHMIFFYFIFYIVLFFSL